jgi:hypothetical protein
MDRPGDHQRLAADNADIGLAVFANAQPRNVRRHDEVVAAARFEQDEFHGRRLPTSCTNA